MVTLESTPRNIFVDTVLALCAKDMADKGISFPFPGLAYRRSVLSVTTPSNSGGRTVTIREFTPTITSALSVPARVAREDNPIQPELRFYAFLIGIPTAKIRSYACDRTTGRGSRFY
jgi:hypothetical protein